MDFWAVTLLGGASYGLLLFMLSAGLTLTFGLMGVLNFAHASFYMLGAYVACQLSQRVGFWPALLLAPLPVGALAAVFEAVVLRRIRARSAGNGHMPELLATFGLAYVLLEAVQLVWGRAPLDFQPPHALQGAAFTLLRDASGLHFLWGDAPPDACAAALACTPLPATRAFIALLALVMLLALAALARTRTGAVIAAALSEPQMVQALGHRLPLVQTLVFGAGAALAALAGVAGGSAFVTEPQMAESVATLLFVVVVLGGAGSVAGAFAASMLIGVLQTAAVAAHVSVLDALRALHLDSFAAADAPWLHWSSAQLAPLLPFALLALALTLRPQALMGRR